MRLNWILPPILQKHTPSTEDGIPLEEETIWKVKVINILKDGARKLRLHDSWAVPTGIVFLHRYLTVNSIKKVHAKELACTSLFLAAKAETCPRKLNDFVVRFFDLQATTQQHDTQKQRIMKLERDMITALGFEFTINHPGPYFDHQLESLGLYEEIKTKMRDCGHSLLSDYYFSNLCLMYPCHAIADALTYMALHCTLDWQIKLDDDSRLLGALNTPYSTIMAISDELKAFCTQNNMRSWSLSFRPPHPSPAVVSSKPAYTPPTSELTTPCMSPPDTSSPYPYSFQQQQSIQHYQTQHQHVAEPSRKRLHSEMETVTRTWSHPSQVPTQYTYPQTHQQPAYIEPMSSHTLSHHPTTTRTVSTSHYAYQHPEPTAATAVRVSYTKSKWSR